MSRFEEITIKDPTTGDEANVVPNADDNTDLDGKNGLVANSIQYYRIDADTVKPARMDASTHTVQTIEYEHHEIHAGSHYFICGFETLADNAETNFAITTPNSEKETHMTFDIGGSSQTEILIYEDSAVTNGDPATPINNNRNSDNDSGLVIVKDPTVGTQGSLIYSSSSGKAGTNPSRADLSGLVARDREIILKNNATTIFRIISRDGDNVVSYCGEWYEHTPKD